MGGFKLAPTVVTALLDGTLDVCGLDLAVVVGDRCTTGSLIDCHCRHPAELRQLLFDPKGTERRQQFSGM
jgi:hypothetical protein